MRGKLVVAGVAALAAAMGGCSAGATATPSASASAKAKAAPTPSPMTVVAVTLPAARSGAPSLTTTGTSWLTIVKSLSAYGQWILGNPDPSKVADMAMPGCAVAESLNAQANGLVTSNAYVQTTAPVIKSVVGPSSGAGLSKVALTVIASRAAEPVVSGSDDKTTIGTIAALPESALQVTLTLGADLKWRFCTVGNAAADGAVASQTLPLI